MLNVARGVQGVAAATVNVTSLALVSAAFPEPKAKARAIGIWTAIASVGNAIGPTLGGLLVESFGWRSIFWSTCRWACVVVLLTLRFVAESRDERPRDLDLAGQALFMVTVGAFAYAVIEGPQAGWTSPLILALLAVAAVGARRVRALRAPQRRPDDGLSLFRDRTYALAIVTICVVLFTFYGMLLADHAVPAERARLSRPSRPACCSLPFSVTIAGRSPFVGRHGRQDRRRDGRSSSASRSLIAGLVAR